jgi:hypothetical protein
MTTTIDTAPAANLAINDTTTADTIFVFDGPLENGFQTTEVLPGPTNAIIFANRPL